MTTQLYCAWRMIIQITDQAQWYPLRRKAWENWNRFEPFLLLNTLRMVIQTGLPTASTRSPPQHSSGLCHTGNPLRAPDFSEGKSNALHKSAIKPGNCFYYAWQGAKSGHTQLLPVCHVRFHMSYGVIRTDCSMAQWFRARHHPWVEVSVTYQPLAALEETMAVLIAARNCGLLHLTSSFHSFSESKGMPASRTTGFETLLLAWTEKSRHLHMIARVCLQSQNRNEDECNPLQLQCLVVVSAVFRNDNYADADIPTSPTTKFRLLCEWPRCRTCTSDKNTNTCVMAIKSIQCWSEPSIRPCNEAGDAKESERSERKPIRRTKIPAMMLRFSRAKINSKPASWRPLGPLPLQNAPNIRTDQCASPQFQSNKVLGIEERSYQRKEPIRKSTSALNKPVTPHSNISTLSSWRWMQDHPEQLMRQSSRCPREASRCSKRQPQYVPGGNTVVKHFAFAYVRECG